MQIADRSCEKPVPTSVTSSLVSPPQTAVSYTQKFAQYGAYVGFAAMFAFPTGGDVLASAIVGAVCGGSGAALGSAVGAFFDALREPRPPADRVASGSSTPVLALLLSMLGLGAWIIPVVGLPVTVAGFVLGKRAHRSSRAATATASMALSLLGILLSSANAYWGAFMAVQAGMRAQGH